MLTTCEGTHYLRADSIEQIVTLELRNFAKFLTEEEELFADILEAKTNKSILNQQNFKPVRVLQWNISLHKTKEQVQNLLDT